MLAGLLFLGSSKAIVALSRIVKVKGVPFFARQGLSLVLGADVGKGGSEGKSEERKSLKVHA